MMMRPDVAIVGAGPAGAWTAFLLASAGARVLVFDGSHPREKPCGGGLSARALDVISPVAPRPTLTGVAIRSVRFESRDDGRERATVALGEDDRAQPLLLIVDRTLFDRALLEAALEAGAEWVPERVLEVDGDGDAVRLRTRTGSHRASALVGADGAASLVRRRFLAPFGRPQLSMTAGFFLSGRTSNEAVIRFTSRPAGYLWAFPRRDRMAVGMGAQADMATSVALQSQVSAWLAESGDGRPGDLRPFAWPVPSLTADELDRQRPAGERWLLVGDAAGLVDPLTREGIYYALRSAALAARALCQTKRVAAEDYLAALRRHVYPEIRRAASLKAGFFTAGFTDLLVRALNESASIRSIMAGLISGRQSYRGLRVRLLSTLELGLASSLVRLRRAQTRSKP